MTSDNVAVASVSQSPAPGSMVTAGVVNVTITAQDAAGNSASTSFAVIVADSLPSTSDLVISADPVTGEPPGTTYRPDTQERNSYRR